MSLTVEKYQSTRYDKVTGQYVPVMRHYTTVDTYTKNAGEVVDSMLAALGEIHERFGIPSSEVEVTADRDDVEFAWCTPLAEDEAVAAKEIQKKSFLDQIARLQRNLEALG